MWYKVRTQTTIPNRPYSVNEVTYEVPFGTDEETVIAMVDDSYKLSNEIAKQFQEQPNLSNNDIQSAAELTELRKRFKEIEAQNKMFAEIVSLLKGITDPEKFNELRSIAITNAQRTSHPEQPKVSE